MGLRSWLIVFGLLSSAARAATVWIDTDPSLGSPLREVDDGFALILAFHSPEIRIAGISTSYGNASPQTTTRVARDLVARFGVRAGLKPGLVHQGAASPRDLGVRSDASDALPRSLQKQRLTYIALGPLTNLATFLQLHPRLARRIERVVFLGGGTSRDEFRFGPGKTFEIHDANVFKDPAAAAAVLRSPLPITLVPVGTASGLSLDGADFRDLRRGGDAGIYLHRKSRVWFWFWTTLVRNQGGPIFDAAAIIPVTRPGLLVTETRFARLDRSGNLIVTPQPTANSRPVRYGSALKPGVKAFLLDRLRERPGG